MINDILISTPRIVPKFYFDKNLYFYAMGRNNEKNIRSNNDKLHKAQDKKKAKKVTRSEKLNAIVKKFNDDKRGN